MRVLIGCEFTQIVCNAFRDAGHEAFSCDLNPTEGNPEWHIQDDVLNHLDEGWDLAIFHPDCTFLTAAGNRWFYEDCAETTATERIILREEAIEFYLKLWNCKIKRVAIENPKFSPRAIQALGNHDQILAPDQFGHMEMKGIGLRLRNLPKLVSTHDVKHQMMKLPYKDRAVDHCTGKRKGRNRRKDRSRFYVGIARAMAAQWGNL